MVRMWGASGHSIREKMMVGAAGEFFNETQRGLTEAGGAILTTLTLSAAQTNTHTMAQQMALSSTRDEQKKTGAQKSAL